MPILHFNKATNPATSDDCVHINSDAILFVHESPNMQMGKTEIQVIGLKTESIRVVETLDQVLAQLPELVRVHRHYHAGEPSNGASIVHIAVHNVSYLRRNVPQGQPFWTIRFTDEYELRIIEPLPRGL
jgi:hypothetical protein